MFPERFSQLPPHVFARLRDLLAPVEAGGEVVHMTIGEPKHAFPDFVPKIITDTAQGFRQYPPNEGTVALRTAITGHLERHTGLAFDPATQILPLNGTREGLYNAMAALAPEEKAGQKPLVILPNPFYQVYMVAAFAVGAQMHPLNATRQSGFLPDLDALAPQQLERTSVFYICSPSNPQGAVASRDYWKQLLKLAEKYDFKVFSDECYGDIYVGDTRPLSAVQMADDLGADPERVVMFQSLSKRSNVPGLRSGFAVGGPLSIARMTQLRSYAGAPLPLPLQEAATALWNDEEHVIENRRTYQRKFDAASGIFADYPGYATPGGGFFLWLPVRNGEEAALEIWRNTGVRVLPGAYLAQGEGADNPGQGYLRIALVDPLEIVAPALEKLKSCILDRGLLE